MTLQLTVPNTDCSKPCFKARWKDCSSVGEAHEKTTFKANSSCESKIPTTVPVVNPAATVQATPGKMTQAIVDAGYRFN